MALMLLAIGLFGAITATITSYLLTRDAVETDEPTATARAMTIETTASAGSSMVSEIKRLAALHAKGQ